MIVLSAVVSLSPCSDLPCAGLMRHWWTAVTPVRKPWQPASRGMSRRARYALQSPLGYTSSPLPPHTVTPHPMPGHEELSGQS